MADPHDTDSQLPTEPARDAPAQPAAIDRTRSDDAPESHNAEQDDEDAQTQSVSDSAYYRSSLGLGDTVKVPTGNEGDDVQDLVDHMRQMDSSGIIDMSAFAGERNDDEEEGRYGSAAEEE